MSSKVFARQVIRDAVGHGRQNTASGPTLDTFPSVKENILVSQKEGQEWPRGPVDAPRAPSDPPINRCLCGQT
jgi:hypothetical protein